MPQAEVGAVLALVAPRLRELRQRRGRTLADVARDTGISTSTLSRLESGLRRPTIDLLLQLAHTYDVPLDDLVAAPAAKDPRVRSRAFRHHGATYLPLTRRAEGLQAYKIVLPGRRHDRVVAQGAHDGYDWVYVLSGHLLLALGEERVVLEPGEAAEFDTTVPHAMVSADRYPCELLCLVSSQGERVHIRNVQP